MKYRYSSSIDYALYEIRIYEYQDYELFVDLNYELNIEMIWVDWIRLKCRYSMSIDYALIWNWKLRVPSRLIIVDLNYGLYFETIYDYAQVDLTRYSEYMRILCELKYVHNHALVLPVSNSLWETNDTWFFYIHMVWVLSFPSYRLARLLVY